MEPGSVCFKQERQWRTLQVAVNEALELLEVLPQAVPVNAQLDLQHCEE